LSLPPGTRLGVYDVTALIGEGGMGQVYRAMDTSLGRQVAIKMLPDGFAKDPERLARFEREAKTLASLNHPNIAAIYGFEKSGGVHALVMELVEGDDLSQRIARGAIPIDEALPIARQMAEALEAAHEHGVIHRDLKPANVKVRADGVVKVLDFGLAKAMDSGLGTGGRGLEHASMAPTITTPALMTGVGMILGTAAYMSPEQARGKQVDRRTDIWAFGCVLYEMLTGRRSFDAEDVSLTLARVLEREPDWTALPPAVPAAVRVALRRALEKDRRKRAGDIAVMLFAIDEATALGAGSVGDHVRDTDYVPKEQAAADITAAVTTALESVRKAERRRSALFGAAALLAGTTLAGGITWSLTRPTPPTVTRLEIATSGAEALAVQGNDRDFAITPDGSRIVYRVRGALLVRALDQLAPTAIRGLGEARGIFVSPDGEWAGFFDGVTLKKVALTGGAPVTVVSATAGAPRGATWSDDGTIVFAGNGGRTGLLRVPASGGDVTTLTTLDAGRGERGHWWPEFLPGGQAVLFTILPSGGGLDSAEVALLDLQTGTQSVLVKGGHHAQYLASGHLVYGAGRTLRAVPFDLARRAVSGSPVPVVESVLSTAEGAVEAAVAANGTLVYVPGGGGLIRGVERRLVWVDREGREEPVPGAPVRSYLYPRLSPDGSQVAVDIRDQAQDIWVWAFQRQTLSRLTFDPALDAFPNWTPDGRRLIWSSRRAGPYNLYAQAADGTGSVERLTEHPLEQRASSVTPDGRQVLFYEDAPGTLEQDLAALPLTGDRHPTRITQTMFAERNGEASPDGRWLAFESNESGQPQIYVRPWPTADAGRWQVSTGGGVQPLWARNGRELFYLAPDGSLIGVPVETASRGTSFASGTPTKLVAGEGYSHAIGTANLGRTYDVSLDGRRFLMIKEGSGDDAQPRNLVVVQHWTEELKRLVPAN